MSNFLIGIEHDVVNGSYTACFLDGTSISLSASTYEDAVLEADLLTNEVDNYELGYN
jgi:hypothetical protein